MDVQTGSKRISCKRCQTRKIKCDRKQPCVNCSGSGIKCEYSSRDGRRRPVSHAYVSALESRVASYESLLKKLKHADAEERDVLLGDVILDDHLGSPRFLEETDLPNVVSEPTSPLPTGSLKRGASGALQYHGPTSIYLDDGMDDSIIPEPSTAESDVHAWSDLRLASAVGITEPLVNEALGIFFAHQYPQFMFVYREAFLADYFSFEHGGKYWSFSLLYALGALGIAHSLNAQSRAKAPVFAKCAEEIVITHELGRPTFTTVQALLCLAFHELGQGSSSKGWLLSGMAFRMGQDLGFQRDPRHWVSKDRSILTPADSEIRRRIYWGCFLADKFISLFMGRPVFLVERDAEVKPVEPLPDFPDDHEWFGLTKLANELPSLNGSSRPQLTKGLRHMVLLGEIFQNIMGVLFAPKGHPAQADHSSIFTHLDKFNLRLNKWHSDLPECLQWSRWALHKEPIGTNILTIHLFYHSVVMSLNRHFIGQSKITNVLPYEQSQTACENSCDIVIAITRQFRSQPLTKSPPILLIYALVTVAITIVTTSGRESSRSDGRIPFIIKVLADYSPQFRLAGEMRMRLSRFFRIPTPAQTLAECEFNGAKSHVQASGIEEAQSSCNSGRDMAMETDSPGVRTIFESDLYEDLWSGGFQDWFVPDENNAFM